MGERIAQARSKGLWDLVASQHGVVSRSQLLAAGMSAKAINHRITTGRLHPVFRGVYAVGRPDLTKHGGWMAAVLACGPGAVLSHRTGAAHLGIWQWNASDVEITLPASSDRRPAGVLVYRRSLDLSELIVHERIPVTCPLRMLLDLAVLLRPQQTAAALNEAVKRDLLDLEQAREQIETFAGTRGVRPLRELIDRHTFRLTDSELERVFLRLVRQAGLPLPETGRHILGFKIDFFWPALGLIVETDGLRYHRTPEQQAHDRLRDQRLVGAGLTVLRFTHHQVRHQPAHVVTTLKSVARRLHQPRLGS